jgi:hypothetical protein
MRRWQLCLLFAMAFAVWPVAGQQTTDVAPSARFPAAWYSPEHQVMSTMPPVTGAPYEARVVTSNQFGRTPVERAPLQARDSAGRTRTESAMGPRTAQDGTQVQVEVREVGVTDPVSQCSFQWEEPWLIKDTPTATVQCQRHKAEYAGQAMWASSASMRTGEEHPSPDETDETEASGERTFDGLRAVGFRRVRIIKNPDPKQSQTIESEVWTSPEMKEIVAIYVKQGTNVELQQIKVGEPDPKMFYPPAGYKIEPATSHP